MLRWWENFIPRSLFHLLKQNSYKRKLQGRRIIRCDHLRSLVSTVIDTYSKTVNKLKDFKAERCSAWDDFEQAQNTTVFFPTTRQTGTCIKVSTWSGIQRFPKIKQYNSGNTKWSHITVSYCNRYRALSLALPLPSPCHWLGCHEM